MAGASKAFRECLAHQTHFMNGWCRGRNHRRL